MQVMIGKQEQHFMAIKNNKKKRARTKKGRYVADDPSTPNVNEAYVNGSMSILEGYNNNVKKCFTIYG